MENKRATARRQWKPYCSCTVLMLVIPILFACLVVAWLKGVPNDVLRWVKSFEFPAIEARYQPMADELASLTSDQLVDESHTIRNTGFMTNNDFTGVVAGDFTKVFGTNRLFNNVLDDYVRFLSALPDWKVNTSSYALAYNTDHTAKIIIRLPDKTEVPSETWIKYRTIYEVSLIYGDPDLWEP
jgi:hypothetical protein